MGDIGMIVAEVMNRNIKTIRPDSTVKEAANLMSQYHIGSLIVLTGSGTLVGIVTERDILEDVVAAGRDSESVSVEEIMTTEVVTINPEATLEEAANAMNKFKIKKLPVLKDGGVVGIITASDLITYENRLIEKVSELIQMKKDAGVGG